MSKIFPFTGDGGGAGQQPSTKIFSSLNMYQAKSGVKIFSLYWRVGGAGRQPSTKNFFSSLNMYQAKSGVKNFSLYWGEGVPQQKFFFHSEHVSSQIWCQKFFPLLGGGSPQQNFFSGLNMYQAKSGVKNLFLYWGGWGRAAALNKNFFPV